MIMLVRCWLYRLQQVWFFKTDFNKMIPKHLCLSFSCFHSQQRQPVGLDEGTLSSAMGSLCMDYQHITTVQVDNRGQPGATPKYFPCPHQIPATNLPSALIIHYAQAMMYLPISLLKLAGIPSCAREMEARRICNLSLGYRKTIFGAGLVSDFLCYP